MFHSKPKHSFGDFFEGMLIGTSLGAITTFFLGTEKGKKLQKDLAHNYRKMEHKIAHYRDDVMHSPVVRKLKRKAKSAMKYAMAARKTAKKTVRRKKTKTQKRKSRGRR